MSFVPRDIETCLGKSEKRRRTIIPVYLGVSVDIIRFEVILFIYCRSCAQLFFDSAFIFRNKQAGTKTRGPRWCFYRGHVTIGGGCRRSFLVDVWGNSKSGGICVQL